MTSFVRSFVVIDNGSSSPRHILRSITTLPNYLIANSCELFCGLRIGRSSIRPDRFHRYSTDLLTLFYILFSYALKQSRSLRWRSRLRFRIDYVRLRRSIVDEKKMSIDWNYLRISTARVLLGSSCIRINYLESVNRYYTLNVYHVDRTPGAC